MPSTIIIGLATLIGLFILKNVLQLWRNIAEAKASGIPYIVLPVFQVNRLYQLAGIVLTPVLRALPSSWTDPWLDLTLDWEWKRRYEPFARVGADTFLAVSPGKITLNTAEASVIDQMTSRRHDFPKALEVYEMLQIFGNNVITVEGQDWRRHRKITSPPFSEANNVVVWKETLSQTEAMINGWFPSDKERSKTLRKLAVDAMRLTLHIISKAGFGKTLTWPAQAPKVQDMSNSELMEGHTLTYIDALSKVLDHILAIMILPRFLLANLPFKSTRLAYTSYVEWGKYMKEMFDTKKALILAGEGEKEKDLMASMVKTAGVISTQGADPKTSSNQNLSEGEVIGNAFIFLLAGHETTANSVHFCLVYLALNISSQRHLQRDIDATFQGRPVSDWNYEKDVPKLFGNMVGAVMNEELRLIPPVVGIPKKTEPGKPQLLTVGGKQCTVPADTYIALVSTAAHRNPNQWPAGPPADPENPSHPFSNKDNDLEEFKPERWLLQKKADRESSSKASHGGQGDTDSLGMESDSITSPSLFKPVKGAYIPFSEGYRSCLGRRFAQIELLAFLAFVFSQYSIELSVEKWASDEQVEKMSEVGKREVWERAKAKIDKQMIQDMESVITLQLRKGHIPLRLVKRGREMFDFK